ncbi:glucosamine--fructose-6-phosphate aminotransferase [Streptomyces sp. NPDC000594]|uniref:glucosamine--fructose-6-phosphate aminotransferase n=1 Tax=Streptomyces sp. NPDC000594 TaxID=3154261 RepID=UPI0033192798
MCALVGYVGGRSALDVVMAGLERWERRAEQPYDAAGVAILADGGLATARTVGTVGDLGEELRRRPLPSGSAGLGQLRAAGDGWSGGTGDGPSGGTGEGAGGVPERDAPPQLDHAGRVAVVQDGVIENHAVLRAELAGRGQVLSSGTPAEVVAHLLAGSFSSCGDLAEAVRQVHGLLRGVYALAAVDADEPDTVVAVGRGIPLVVGVGDGETFLAPDPAAFVDGVFSVVEPGPDRVVELGRDGVVVTDPQGVPVDVRPYGTGVLNS